MSVLREAALTSALSAIDLQFAELMESKSPPAQARSVALAAALVSAERARGQSCFSLREGAGRNYPAADGAALPEFEAWARDLRESGLAGDGTRVTPMVLDAAGRAYLYRYWIAEQRLAARVRARLALPPEDGDFESLAPSFRKLFPGAPESPDRQALAAAACLRGRFAVVSGGPGTGKTATVARALALLRRRDPAARIALAAPTGKAAARLAEAVGEPAMTLHRLMGYDPAGDRFRFDAARPLALDAAIVDEASMADLLLMDALFAALPTGARLVLIGDSGQLASVETGYVLGDLCQAAGAMGKSPAFAAAYERLSGARIESRAAATPLEDAAVELQHNWRFQDRPALCALAAAVRAGRADEAMGILARGGPDVVYEPHAEGARGEECLAPMLPSFESVCAAVSPAEALERFGAARVLCAVRRGPWGVERLNAGVESALRRLGRRLRGPAYGGRPVMITANDYNLSIFNGDIGILRADDDGAAAWFGVPGAGPRRVSPARLPPHEAAWAMTVHKAQGSEFDDVLLVLPDRDSPILTRELLYTGLTRARRRLRLAAPPGLVRLAITRRAARPSGLASALRET